MQSITAYLLEYTLVYHYGSNKSELARQLGMRRTDFSRKYDRCMAGDGSSLTALEALLNLYYVKGFSLDEALAGYATEAVNSVSMQTCNRCKENPARLRDKLRDATKSADQQVQVLRSAEQFLTQMERMCCTASCKAKSDPNVECPYENFGTFTAWLMKQFCKG